MQSKKTVLLFLTGTIIMATIMQIQGDPLKTTTTPRGILEMEFAHTMEKTIAVTKAWGGKLSQIFYTNTLLDFLFIFCYGGFLFTASRYFYNRIAIFQNFGKRVSYLALAAVAFDIFENILMLLSFGGHIQPLFSMLTFLFASAKSICICFVLIFIAIAWICSVMNKKKVELKV